MTLGQLFRICYFCTQPSATGHWHPRLGPGIWHCGCGGWRR